MPYNIRIISTYPPRRCGIGTFSRSLASALSHFTAEVGYIRIAAIDNNDGPYEIPVDLIIDQYNPKSWSNTVNHIYARSKESITPTVVVLQHEYGLDPDDDGNAGRGINYIDMAKAFRERGLITPVYLHTVLDEPNDHQRNVLLELAEHSDGLIVTTESAISILESPSYGIDHSKLTHIDHGIRMHNPSQFDRLEIKKQLGLENHFLATTLGLQSPSKGLQYSIPAYGRFVNHSCTTEQRKRIVYLIIGQCHPEFVTAEGGSLYRDYQKMLSEALDDAKVKWCKVKDLNGVDFNEYDIVFYDTFLNESGFLKFYGATNVMLLPYLNMEQISSGILADVLGSGRIAISTKFRYAVELIHSNKQCPEGAVIGRYARGILVDPGDASVEQIAQGLDYLVFNEKKRLLMEKQAHQRGYQMRWSNSAWAFLQYIEFIREQKEIVTGRGVKFTRKKPSVYEIKKRRTS
ncbi:MAG: hypothetical protein GY774_18755 [Planctomycetes bacterium]|nr:hypothetical protein [Planctomycetota bacterium]